MYRHGWAYGGTPSLGKQDVLAEKGVHGCVKVRNGFGLAPAVSFSGVDVILVWHTTAFEGRHNGIRLGLRHNLIDLSLKQRNRIAQTVSGKERRALAI